MKKNKKKLSKMVQISRTEAVTQAYKSFSLIIKRILCLNFMQSIKPKSIDLAVTKK